jgi:hypothetical protein
MFINVDDDHMEAWRLSSATYVYNEVGINFLASERLLLYFWKLHECVSWEVQAEVQERVEH